VLFKQNSYEGTVKLTDFGLSKAVDNRDMDTTFSTTTAQAGTEIGSFGYYAPEVHRHGDPTSKVCSV
jgi:serine/threonine protein kinase